MMRHHEALALFTVLLTMIIPAANPQSDQDWQSYTERNQKSQEVRHFFRSEGNQFFLKTELESGIEQQRYELNETGETIAWTYEDTSRDMQLSATLSTNRTIRMTGHTRGKTVDKTFEINDQPWNQRFQQGLGRFLLGSEEKTVFWSIGTRGKGELKITRFTVRRQPGKPVPALLRQTGYSGPFHHIKLSLHGMLSMFWSGNYWYDAKDESFLFYQGKSSHLDGNVILIKTRIPLPSSQSAK